MRVCFVASEIAPFAKTGGLADVSAALPRTLHRLGHDLRLFMPLYGRIDRGRHATFPVEFLQELTIELGGRRFGYSVYTTALPRSSLPVYLVSCPALFGGPELYTGDARDALRFTLLTHAAIQSCQRMGFAPDILHANDWHTALAPLLLANVYHWDRLFASTRTVLTIHNVGYQGIFPASLLGDLGLGDHSGRFYNEDLAAGHFSFLKTGILHSDVLTTVSPTHAHEIQTPEYGMGLDGLLRRRADHLVGILNGIDPEEWNPQSDALIPFNYSAADLEGKAFNKLALSRDLGLDHDPRVPALGIVTRLVKQKGIELLQTALPRFLATVDCRLAVLGSGEPAYEQFFTALERRFPGRVCFFRGYSEELAHRIEAGCDLFLMPSLYEPCGLNQMYSLAYGTAPVVRRTGGLADSVELFDRATGRGTGFVFEHATAEGLRWALDYAMRIWQDRPAWDRLVQNAMSQDFSWERQAGRYVDLYRRLART